MDMDLTEIQCHTNFSTRLSLINRDIIWVTAHIRGWIRAGNEMVEGRKAVK